MPDRRPADRPADPIALRLVDFVRARLRANPEGVVAFRDLVAEYGDWARRQRPRLPPATARTLTQAMTAASDVGALPAPYPSEDGVVRKARRYVDPGDEETPPAWVSSPQPLMVWRGVEWLPLGGTGDSLF